MTTSSATNATPLTDGRPERRKEDRRKRVSLQWSTSKRLRAGDERKADRRQPPDVDCCAEVPCLKWCGKDVCVVKPPYTRNDKVGEIVESLVRTPSQQAEGEAVLQTRLSIAAKLLNEAREDLFRLGQDSATAYERGSFSDADKAAKEIHQRIDQFLNGGLKP